MSIFDFEDGDLIFPVSRGMGIDMDGDLHIRMGDNMSMDLDTGELHITSSWNIGDDDD